jgi:hypothetical protein
MIQVDIDGHPPIPIGSKKSFGYLLFLAGFWFLNFWGHFEGLNGDILGSSTSKIVEGFDCTTKMNLLDDTFPMSYFFPQTEIICQSYAPGKLIHQTTQNRVHKIVAFSSSRIRVLDFLYDKKAFGASL